MTQVNAKWRVYADNHLTHTFDNGMEAQAAYTRMQDRQKMHNPPWTRVRLTIEVDLEESTVQ